MTKVRTINAATKQLSIARAKLKATFTDKPVESAVGPVTWQQIKEGEPLSHEPQEATYKGALPVDLGPNWREVEQEFCHFMAANIYSGAKVIVSVAKHPEDGKDWLHVSVSHPKQIPDYALVAEVKRRFIGANRKAIMVFPDESNHVNLHPHCLHLFSCLDEWGIPEFSGLVRLKDGREIRTL